MFCYLSVEMMSLATPAEGCNVNVKFRKRYIFDLNCIKIANRYGISNLA